MAKPPLPVAVGSVDGLGPLLPLRPPAEFQEWLRANCELTPREIDVVLLRTRSVPYRDVASILGLAESYVKRVQARSLQVLCLRGGRAALQNWLADQYAAWCQHEHHKRCQQ